MQFYDVKAKKKFDTSKYTIKTRVVQGRKRNFAVATSPLTGIECWRIIK